MNKIVIYTAIFGGKDKLLEPEFVPEGCDFVCFTDTTNLKSSIWQIRQEKASSDDPVRSAKLFKILPHRFLGEYEYSVWVDGNILVRDRIREKNGKLYNTNDGTVSLCTEEQAIVPEFVSFMQRNFDNTHIAVYPPRPDKGCFELKMYGAKKALNAADFFKMPSGNRAETKIV